MNISYEESRKVFLIGMETTSYAMLVTPLGFLKHLHWGGAVKRPQDFNLIPDYYVPKVIVGQDTSVEPDSPIKALERQVYFERLDEEYSGWGGYFYGDPGVKATFEDGNRDLLLKYDSHQIEERSSACELKIRLKDNVYDFYVDLHYRIYSGLDVIDRWAVAVNGTKQKVALESFMSAMWHFPRGDKYRLTHMSGKWSGEFQLSQLMLTQSSVTMETKAGVSGHHSAPWFAVDWQANATEEHGALYAGSLHWSGNWRITAQSDYHERVRVTGGIHDFDFEWPLNPGEEFASPIFSGVFTENGFGGASRQLHKYQRQHLIPACSLEKEHSMMYSSWGLYTFNSNINQELDIVPHAAKMGIELYHVDDCWFSTRDSDCRGLGDWWTSKTKFPDGLDPLIKVVKEHGMEFGIWVEPEMVSQDTVLFKEHPEWIIKFPGKQMTTGRNQHVLNFGMKEVQDWAIDWIFDLLGNHEIDFFKWDMNRYISEPGWAQLPKGEQKTIWVRYVQGVYRVFKAVKEKFPKIYVQNCASGGGRVDMGMMAVTDTQALSDCTNHWDRVKIFWGFTQAFVPFASGPASFARFWGEPDNRSELGGWFADPRNFTDEQKEMMRARMDKYKEIRHIIHKGELYRLSSPYKDEYVAYEYILEDKSEALVEVIGLKQTYQRFLRKLTLQALDPDAVYEMSGHAPMSGAGLMKQGLDVTFGADLDNYLIHLKRMAD
jgi:alpha-galactosidase